MAYFPFFIELNNKKCLIFGGGVVAYRKVQALLEFDSDITVIAPSVCKEIKEYGDRIHIIYEEYSEKYLDHVFFVIAATNHTKVNLTIAEACRERNILVNAVDDLAGCDFLFPAYVKRGSISIGVTTSGKSPSLAGQIKKNIIATLPDYYESLADTLGGVREYIKSKVASEQKRADILKELTELGISKKGILSLEEVDVVVKKHSNHP